MTRVLVTGGGGFLGGAIVRMLVARGNDVVTYQRGEYPWLAELAVEAVRGDLIDVDALCAAAEGCDAVIHTAANAGVWGSEWEYHKANFAGTMSVHIACGKAGVSRLVHTSSPSVTFSGEDEEGIDESVPYPDRYLAHYPKTKAQAEQYVLALNGEDIATVALRPHLIWGPGDNHLVPRILDRARRGKLKLVGDGSNRVDSTYIDNAAAAHLLALDQLLAHGSDAACAGKAYFITNGEPLPMRDLINRILAAGGLPPVTKQVSPTVAYAAGAVLETMHKLLRRKSEPIMTRFVATQLSTAHWYDISAAKRDLGYIPTVSLDEGMARLGESLRT